MRTDGDTLKQTSRLKAGQTLLIPDPASSLRTTVTEYVGWERLDSWDGEGGRGIIFESDDESEGGVTPWRELWKGVDANGDEHDLEADDIYRGLGYDVVGDTPGHAFIGKKILFDGALATVDAYLPPQVRQPVPAKHGSR